MKNQPWHQAIGGELLSEILAGKYDGGHRLPSMNDAEIAWHAQRAVNLDRAACRGPQPAETYARALG